MAGTQKWREEEIWFILNRRRRGVSGPDVYEEFRKQFPKHKGQSTDKNSVNYVWNHYSCRPDYAPERFPDFLGRYDAQKDALEAAREEQERIPRPNMAFTARGGTGPSTNSRESSITGPAQNGLASHMRSVSVGPIRATFNHAQPLNVLTSSLSPPNPRSFTREPSRERYEEASQAFQGTYRPDPPFPPSTTSQSTRQFSSPLHPPIDFGQDPYSQGSPGVNNPNRVVKRPRRPAPTSVNRSNAKYTGFRFRRNSNELASKPLPTPAQHQRLFSRISSPPVPQPPPHGPIKVAQFEGFWMTFDPTDNFSGLPYAVYAPDGSRIRNPDNFPHGVFDALSISSARHPATRQQTHAGSSDDMENERQQNPSVKSTGAMQHQEKSEALGSHNGGSQNNGHSQPAIGYAGAGQSQAHGRPQPISNNPLQIPRIKPGTVSLLFSRASGMSTPRGLALPARGSNSNMQEPAYQNNGNGYDSGEGMTGLSHPEMFHAPPPPAYASNQNVSAPALAANHPLNFPPGINHTMRNLDSNLNFPLVAPQNILRSNAEPGRPMDPPERRASVNQRQTYVTSPSPSNNAVNAGPPANVQNPQYNSNMHAQQSGKTFNARMAVGAGQQRMQDDMTRDQALQVLKNYVHGSGHHGTPGMPNTNMNTPRMGQQTLAAGMSNPRQGYQQFGPRYLAATAPMFAPAMNSAPQHHPQATRSNSISYSSASSGSSGVPSQFQNTFNQAFEELSNTVFSQNAPSRRDSVIQNAAPSPFNAHASGNQAQSTFTDWFDLPQDDLVREFDMAMYGTETPSLDQILAVGQTPRASNPQDSVGQGNIMNTSDCTSNPANRQLCTTQAPFFQSPTGFPMDISELADGMANSAAYYAQAAVFQGAGGVGTSSNASGRNSDMHQASAPGVPHVPSSGDLGLGINLNGGSVTPSALSNNLQHPTPANGNGEIVGPAFQAASAIQDNRTITITNANFVAPFVIPSQGTGWIVRKSNILTSPTTGHSIGSFCIANSGTGTVINISNSTFQLWIQFEDTFRTRGSISSSSRRSSTAAPTAPAPGPPSSSRRLSQENGTSVFTAVDPSTKNEPILRPTTRSTRGGGLSLEVAPMSPRYATQSKRPAETPAPEPTAAKRPRTQVDMAAALVAQSVTSADTLSAGSPRLFVSLSPAPGSEPVAALQPEASTVEGPPLDTSALDALFEDDDALDLGFGGGGDAQDAENPWVDDPEEREAVENYELS